MNLAGRISSAGARRLRRWVPGKARPAILMYHRIGSDRFDPWGLHVAGDRFDRQLEWLCEHREVLPLDQFAEQQREGRLSDKAIALTFDDGYASVAAAVPMLERFGMHATVFIPAALIQEGRGFWWDELAGMIMHWTGGPIPFCGKKVQVPPADDRDAVWTPHAQPRTARQKLFQVLWTRLRLKPPSEIDRAMVAIRQAAPSLPPTGDLLLEPEELRSIDPQTIEFGSHGVRHPHLPGLSAAGKAREIEGSIKQCASLTSRTPRAFSYPYGETDAESAKLVEDAGFRCACATGNGFVTARSNPFALPRQYVGDWEPARLCEMLHGS